MVVVAVRGLSLAFITTPPRPLFPPSLPPPAAATIIGSGLRVSDLQHQVERRMLGNYCWQLRVRRFHGGLGYRVEGCMGPPSKRLHRVWGGNALD